MPTKKTYKIPAENFITKPDQEEPAQKAKTQPAQSAPDQVDTPQGFIVPKGYRLAPELKNARIQILCRESTKQSLRTMAYSQGTSLNDYINQILEDYIERNSNE